MQQPTPAVNNQYPYRHLHQDDVEWLRDQCEQLVEKTTELFASNLDAIPEDLDGVNSAYLALEMELAWREVEAESGINAVVDAEDVP